MAVFAVAGRTVELPASLVRSERTGQSDAWLKNEWVTVRVDQPMKATRVHTNGRTFSETDIMWEREASNAKGAWAAIGDVILTASQMLNSSALPGLFTHVAEVTIPEGCVINVGFNGCTLMGRGGGTQVEYVSGPRFQFIELTGKVWLNRSGTA